jgi:hypothetical protein
LIKGYFAQFGGIRDYIDSTLETARKRGYVETVTGRRRYLPDINSANGTTRAGAERNAINTPIQGTAADMIKIATSRGEPMGSNLALCTRLGWRSLRAGPLRQRCVHRWPSRRSVGREGDVKLGAAGFGADEFEVGAELAGDGAADGQAPDRCRRCGRWRRLRTDAPAPPPGFPRRDRSPRRRCAPETTQPELIAHAAT